jgi:two-component system nitrogen regulation sensor histidine kinase NtrY
MTPAPGRRARRRKYETRLTWMCVLSGLPAMTLAMWILWNGDYTPKEQWTATVLLTVVWLGFCFAVRERIIRPLQTVANLLGALQEGDYSIRARLSRTDDALDEVYREVNTLGRTLQEQRLGALEATALLRTVMAEIDVAIFTFDGDRRLRLVNRAGERLLAAPAERILGRTARELGLGAYLEGGVEGTVTTAFPGGAGRWGMHLRTFRERGLPHQLLVVENLTRALREEELEAWKRLVRVLGHELNNSLAPIKSIAGSLGSLVGRDELPGDWREDAARGLGVIASRAEALSRFLESYARLAKLPAPRRAPLEVPQWVERVARLETRVPVSVIAGPPAIVHGDGDQLDQLLINLVQNAADASLETRGAVRVGWRRTNAHLEVWVEDEGHGISNPANLFVPFFTTKPGGSGIGLVLSRQIAEAHGGALALENRRSGAGCEARLRLPL